MAENKNNNHALSTQLKGSKSRYIAPGAHWIYNDKPLSDIYDETYPFEENE